MDHDAVFAKKRETFLIDFFRPFWQNEIEAEEMIGIDGSFYVLSIDLSIVCA